MLEGSWLTGMFSFVFFSCLGSLGKSSRAALENVYAQTSVLLEELRRDGGDGAFVSVDNIVDDIPPSRLCR